MSEELGYNYGESGENLTESEQKHVYEVAYNKLRDGTHGVEEVSNDPSAARAFD